MARKLAISFNARGLDYLLTRDGQDAILRAGEYIAMLEGRQEAERFVQKMATATTDALLSLGSNCTAWSFGLSRRVPRAHDV
jgi:plasmid stabilization system protein ParE